MITIRRGTFETNSSSSHSITIASHYVVELDDKDESLKPNNHGTIRIPAMDFGRGPYKEYMDKLTKAAYCAASVWNQNILMLHDIEKVIMDNVKSCKRVEFEWCDYNGNELSHYNGDMAYVDHESEHLAEKTAFQSYCQLEKFIFSKDSVLIIDSDG